MISFFDLWVSRRYLFPKMKDGFFSIITIFSFIGISLGVATLIIVMSVMNGFREELTSKVLGINGHLKVQLFNNTQFKKSQLLIDKIKSDNDRIIVDPTITTQGLISYRNFSSGILIKGLNLDSLRQREIIMKNITPETLKNFNISNSIILGKKLKEKLNINVNDYVKLISPKGIETPFGKVVRDANFKVAGFFETGMYEYDLSLAIVPIESLQIFLDIDKRIDNLEIFLPDFNSLDEEILKIKKVIPNYFIITDWRQLNPSLFNAIEVERNVMFLILMLIILVAVFNLISSMVMLVSNKKRDIGILRTLGVSRAQILKIFIINGSIIGIIGTLLGLVFGITFCQNINEIKAFLEYFTDSKLFSEEIYFFSNLPIIINPKEIFNIVSISLFLSLIATIYPAFKASKTEPINLIKWD